MNTTTAPTATATATATPARFVRRGLSLWVLVLALVAAASVILPSVEGLTIGRRRIQCTTPVGGNPDVDALMEPRPNLPYVFGFVGFQAFLPSLGQCPASASIQPPWFSGKETSGGGLCPPEYFNLGASLPGLLIIGAAAVWTFYIESNRLLVTGAGLGTLSASANSDIQGFEEEVLFQDVTNWFMTPIGLVVKSSETTNFFPLSWDPKSLEAVLEERMPQPE